MRNLSLQEAIQRFCWVSDGENTYPLQSQQYTGKPPGIPRQDNLGEKTGAVTVYKDSGRNVTTDNFFTTLRDITKVRSVRENKKLFLINMQPNKEKPLYSTIFAYSRNSTIYSYVPKKTKAGRPTFIYVYLRRSGRITSHWTRDYSNYN